MSRFKLSLFPYVDRLRKAADKEVEIDRILKEIDKEFFCSTEKHLSRVDKINIINHLQFVFCKKKGRRTDESTARTIPCYKYIPPEDIAYLTDNSEILKALEKAKKYLEV